MKKKLLMLFSLVVVVVALLGGAYWYWQNPKRVVESSMSQLSKAKTAKFTADIGVVASQASAASSAGQQPDTINFIINGSFERHSNVPASMGATLKVDTKVQNVTDTIDGEARLLNNSAYLFLRNVPSFLTELVPLKGQWIAFNRSGIAKPENPPLTGKKLFVEVNSQGQQKLGSESLARYRAMATSDAVISMMDGLSGLLGTQLTDQQIDGLRKTITSGSTLPVDFWVTPLTHELRQVGMTFAVPNGNTLIALISFTDFNKPVNITAPSGSRALADVVQELQKQASPSPTASPVGSPAPSSPVLSTPTPSGSSTPSTSTVPAPAASAVPTL